MSIEVLPFCLGLFLTLVQPIYDKVWRNRLPEVWGAGAVNTEPPLGGAIWAADLASFLPAALLAVLGVALLVDRQNPGIAGEGVVIIIGILVTFAIYILAAYRTGITEVTKTWWSILQYILMGFNAVGVALCIWLPPPASMHTTAVKCATALLVMQSI